MSQEHPFIQTIKKYYHGCSTADVELMKSTFTADVVHYFTDHAPIRGAASLAAYCAKMQPRIQATWICDHAIVQGDECVIEWTMTWTPPTGKAEAMRGAEWYIFRENKIAEIRAYYMNRHLPYEQPNFELQDFPYAERDYTLLPPHDARHSDDR